MKFQSFCMSLFCAATLAAALPVEPSAESATQPCIPAELAKIFPGAPKDLFCKDKAQPERRDGEPSIEECIKALEDYRSGNEEVGPLLHACEAAYGPPQPEKRQAPPPSGAGGALTAAEQAAKAVLGI
ncbi:hypothetical protein BDV24DRAFT_162183 [Aspergillus arachidicola]|uniref:Uncharacterized protein n=1 Tax=Aspergillus arachidicola TaxID=656916 RepID=A0A5N6YGC8_9EURO|nr:hypothetical protein BDV24DRAFT_162183 [Aspergillus arachidicola]